MTTAIIRVYRVKQIPSDVAYAGKFRKQNGYSWLHHRNARRIFQPQRKSRSLYFGENDEILEDMSEGQTNKYFDLYDSISAQMIR